MKKKIPGVSVDILVIKDNKILLGLLTKKWIYNGQQVYGVPGRDIRFGEKIPQNLFPAAKNVIDCYLSGKFNVSE